MSLLALLPFTWSMSRLIICCCVCVYLLLCVCLCVPWSICFCEKMQSGIHLIISSPLIMLLCYDMLARVRLLRGIFGVITKRHPYQLITNPVSNDEGSSPVTSIQPWIHFQLWSLRKISCVNRADGLFTILVEVTETQKPKVPLGLRTSLDPLIVMIVDLWGTDGTGDKIPAAEIPTFVSHVF